MATFCIACTEVLNEKFTLPVQRKRTQSDCDPETLNTTYLESPTLSNSSGFVSGASTPTSVCGSASIGSPAGHSISSTPKRSRSCFECEVLEKERLRLGRELQETTEENEKLKAKVKTKFKKEPRKLQQSLNRLTSQNEKLVAEKEAAERRNLEAVKKLKSLSNFSEQIETLKDENTKLKKQKAEMQRYNRTKKGNSGLTEKLESAQTEMKLQKEKIRELENMVLELEEKLEETINTMDGKQYDAKTRKCIKFCLEKNVSHANASSIVDFIVTEMTGRKIDKLPAASTCANIEREFGIISNIQSGEIISESTNSTLAWDGTSKSGTHYNETHVVTARASLTLNIAELPGAKAVDYATDIRDALEDVTNAYSQCFDQDPAETSKKIHDGEHKIIK